VTGGSVVTLAITNDLLEAAVWFVKSSITRLREKNKSTGIPVSGIDELRCCLQLIKKQRLYRSGHSAWVENAPSDVEIVDSPKPVVSEVKPVVSSGLVEVVKPC
jgi:hypothetical protein